MVTTMKKAQRTRQFIIEKAAPLFNQKGFAGTSITDIMEVTKLAKGGVYGNFESKAEICRESFNYLAMGLSDRLDKVVARERTGKQKLFALLDFYEEYLLQDDDGGCPILNFGVEADDAHPVIKEQVNNIIWLFQGRISRIVQDGIEAGEFLATFPAAEFAIKMFTLLEGALLIGRIQESYEQMRLITGLLKAEIRQYLVMQPSAL